MTSLSLSQQLAELAAHSLDHGVPDAVAVSVRDRLLDVVGLGLAAQDLDTSVAIVEYVRRQASAPEAHILGQRTLTSSALAALANGVLAHSLDYDDTHLPSVVHPSASIIPAALAAAEATDSDGYLFVRATAVGLEVCVRLGMAGYDRSTRTSIYFEHGQHATSICGAVGAAVTAGMLRGLDGQGITNAIGIASSMASGVIEANRTGGTVKRVHCGWAAHAGVTAAELVSLGFTGPPTVLEGRFGLFESFLHGQFDATAVTDGLGERWAVPDIFFKPYPANHFTHTIIDAGRMLRAQDILPEQVESIVVGVPASVVRTVGEPIERKRRPTTTYEAQFSAPYALAVGMFGGEGLGASVADYRPDLFTDSARRLLMDRTSVVADDECSALFPDQFPSVVRGTTTANARFEVKALENRGGPGRPLGASELRTKFVENVAGTFETAQVDAVLSTIDEILDGRPVADLMALLSASPTPTIRKASDG